VYEAIRRSFSSTSRPSFGSSSGPSIGWTIAAALADREQLGLMPSRRATGYLRDLGIRRISHAYRRFLSVALPKNRFFVRTMRFQFCARRRFTRPAFSGDQLVVCRVTEPTAIFEYA
jgi:hypothetical protein